MASRTGAVRALLRSAGTSSRRALHSSSHARAVTEFKMPSMSPTMESGKISAWKVKEGDKFSAGDIILVVETDKAEVDIEAQDDGVVGKIVLDEKATSIVVGKTIALFAEEGDDISNLSAPEEAEAAPAPKAESSDSKPSTSASSTSSSSTTHSPSPSNPSPAASSESSANAAHEHAQPEHFRPLLPSVARMLLLNNISTEVKDLKGSGIRGQLTKGDVLVHLGKIKNAQGSEVKLAAWREAMDKPKDGNKGKPMGETSGKKEAKKEAPVLTGAQFKSLIISGLARRTSAPATPSSLAFEDILQGYPSSSSSTLAKAASPSPAPPKTNSFDAFLSGY